MTLEEIAGNVKNQAGVRITDKLNRLYNGIICMPEETLRFINLSSHQLTDAQIELLQLGSKLHFKPKFDPLTKKAECELLYENILKLVQNDSIEINQNLKP